MMCASDEYDRAGPTDWEGMTFDAEWIDDHDRSFFDLHPHRSFRFRAAIPGEFGPKIDFAPLDRDMLLLVVVVRGVNALAKTIIGCRGKLPKDEDAELAELVMPRARRLH